VELRPYQVEAVESVYAHLRERDDNPCVVLPTAAGKTPVMATICRDAVDRWNGRVLILAHVKELLEQSVEKLMLLAPGIPVGVYSAGLRRRELEYAVTVAGIQSIWKRAGELGAVDLIIVDEAHLIPAEDDGMYRSFLADAKKVNPVVRVIGLTATPFRLKSGEICSPEPGSVLNHVCYEAGVKELIAQGYLSALRTKAGSQRPDYEQLHVRAGEFIPGEVEELMDEESLVQAACAEILAEAADRRSILIFASGIKHAKHIVETFRTKHGAECGFVSGETPPSERAAILKRFRSGDLRLLANVNVLTTGFDAPNIDCVALLRPTMSPGLYYQMVGRGFRLHPGKTDCLILDFGGNVLRHGPVDDIRVRQEDRGDGDAPAKQCPQCRALIAAGYTNCPQCGFEFPPPEREKHDATATDAGILSGQVTRTEEQVLEVAYAVHYKRDDPTREAPPTLRIDYRVGFNQWYREWVCIEHEGFARRKAERWWETRSRERVPDTVQEAVDLANAGALASTHTIIVEQRAGEKYPRIVDHRLGDRPPRLESDEGLPETVPPSAPTDQDFGEIPF